MENYFKLYYDALDAFRREKLSEEYKLRSHMEEFEDTIRKLLCRTKHYSMIEFFFDKIEII